MLNLDFQILKSILEFLRNVDRLMDRDYKMAFLQKYSAQYLKFIIAKYKILERVSFKNRV